jgi:hypothetical protein
MPDVTVIASELDGAELRREKRRRRLHVRCEGQSDQNTIQEALTRSDRATVWTGLGDAWDRIFGGR